MTSLNRAPNGDWFARKVIPAAVRESYRAAHGVGAEARFRRSASWKPELHALLTDSTVNAEIYMSYAALEPAINTFVDEQDQHRLFESDSDLDYPPDMQRYLNFLGDIVHAAIAFAEKLASIAIVYVDPPNYEENWMELAKKAGQTEFKYLSRGGR